jgi:hypothetical protein
MVRHHWCHLSSWRQVPTLCLYSSGVAGAPQKRRAIKVSGDTAVFESGQLGKNLSTYKEVIRESWQLFFPSSVSNSSADLAFLCFAQCKAQSA